MVSTCFAHGAVGLGESVDASEENNRSIFIDQELTIGFCQKNVQSFVLVLIMKQLGTNLVR